MGKSTFMKIRFSTLAVALLGFAGVAVAEPPTTTESSQPNNTVSFKNDIMPIIQYRCIDCHQAGGQGLKESGLNMSSYEDLMKGTKFGPVVVPGNAMISNLLVLVEGKAAIRMPHNKRRLTQCEIQQLRDWVNQGAKNN